MVAVCRCRSCGQKFDSEDIPVGNPLGEPCTPKHLGPFDPIPNQQASHSVFTATENRLRFESYLHEIGITPGTTRNYHVKVDQIMLQFGGLVRDSVSSGETARKVWQRGLARLGTSTRLKVATEQNVILDGEVLGAQSNKSYFQYVIVDNVPLVFKYPLSNDLRVKEESLKDVSISKVLETAPGYGSSNLVKYRSLHLSRFTGGTTIGSTSHSYIMALHAVARPVTAAYAVAIVHAIGHAVDFMHSLNIIHCDIKPENVFLGSCGELHLGDFGSSVTLGSELTSITIEYMPPELQTTLATTAHDHMCLVNTVLTVMNARPTNHSVGNLRAAVLLLLDEKLKQALLALFR